MRLEKSFATLGCVSGSSVHMNGRVYDYNLGRFLSVDPIIQSPGNSQSMNPYSYIMNNPLAGTDPSGYSADCGSVAEGGSCNVGDIQMKDVDNISVTKDGNMVVNTTNGNSYQVETVNGNNAQGKFTVSNGNQNPSEIGSQSQINQNTPSIGDNSNNRTNQNRITGSDITGNNADEASGISDSNASNNGLNFNIGDTVYSNEGEASGDFLARIAPRWTELTNEEKAEVSSYLYFNKESAQYAVLPYSSGLPQLSVNKPESIENFRNTGKTVHSHGPKVTWNNSLARRTLAFINEYSSSRSERESLKATYYTPYTGKRGIVRLGGNRNNPSDQDKQVGSGWLITNEKKALYYGKK